MNSLDEILVERYLSGECSEVEMDQIFQWLKVSEDHRKEWLKLRMVSVKGNFVHFSDPKHVAQSYKELMQQQYAREGLELKIARRVAMQFMRYAAGIIVLVGLSYASYRHVTCQKPPKMVIVAVSGNEPVRKIILSDSTGVWLSAGSKIEYPEEFGQNERNVCVEGKVYFEVAKDELRPFFVKTDTYTVKVLGTSFEVNAYKFSQTSDVTIVEGNVEILDHRRSALCALQPGQQFEIDKLTNRFTLQQVEAEMYAAWHGGTLEFDGLTFAEIAKILERHYSVQIIISEGIARNQRLVGSLSFEKNIQQMMRAIELVVPIKYHVKTDTVVYIQAKK